MSDQTRDQPRKRRPRRAREQAHPVTSPAPPAAPPVATRPSPRWSLLVALAAGLCWAGVFALLFLAQLDREPDPFAPQRLYFCGLVFLASMLTFVPVEHTMQLTGLAVEGVFGTFMLLYTLAFVPPPTRWLLWLPDIPVYVLLTAALFWTVAAVVLPFVYVVGQRLLQGRARQHDLRRARRQAYEVGALAASAVILAGLGVFGWVSMLLVLLILVVAELLFLARVRVGSAQA